MAYARIAARITSSMRAILLWSTWLIATVHSSDTGYTITPSPLIVGLRQKAVFRCLHSVAPTILWKLNDTVVGENDFPDVVKFDETTTGDGTIVPTINITAVSNFNGTRVVCVAVFGNLSTIETIPVSLSIQGPLSIVTDFRRNSSIITWVAPFSLDLTGVDPNIVYCVEVYNITCGVDDLVVGDCNVTQPRYEDSNLQGGHIYRIAIIPRSNGQNEDVKNAQNGTSFTVIERFLALRNPVVSIIFKRETTASAIVHFNNYGTDGGINPISYSLNLSSIDGIEDMHNDLTLPTSLVRDATLEVACPLPRRRLWNYQILALGCSGSPVTNLSELSTHDIQNINLSSSSAGEISVTGNFINGSTATAMLVIVYSDRLSDVYYMFSPSSSKQEKVMTIVTGLSSGLYNVSIFVVKENGLPFNRSATTPRSVSVTEGGRGTFEIEYEVQSTSTGVCITCTFLESSATDCVAVVHQKISQLSSNGLMNIKSSHKFNRSGDTVIGCIEGINLEQYQFGVVGGRQIFNMQANEGRSQSAALIAGITSGVVSIVIIVVVVVVLLIWTQIRERQVIHTQQQQQQQQPGDSSSLKPLTTPPGKVQGEEAYDVLRGPPKTSTSKQEEAHVTAAGYSTLGTRPPQSGVLYTSVNLGQPSGTMGHDDLHKTMTQYSELQQVPQEEELFNKGPGNIYAVTRSDTVTSGDVLSDFNDELVYIFNSAQGYVVPSELTSLVEDTDDHDGT